MSPMISVLKLKFISTIRIDRNYGRQAVFQVIRHYAMKSLVGHDQHLEFHPEAYG